MNTLQDVRENRYHLITSLESILRVYNPINTEEDYAEMNDHLKEAKAVKKERTAPKWT
jgi:hypothetical protein